MLYRPLGRTGLPVSALSLATRPGFGRDVGRDEVRRLLACAWDQGVNLFHSSQAHGAGQAEQLLGDVIADLRLPRAGFCVASRMIDEDGPGLWPMQRGLSRKSLFDGCNGALRRLRLDYLDVYLCPQPDPQTPVEEIVRTMDLLIGQGKVLYWGTSGWPVARVLEAVSFAQAEGLSVPSLERSGYNLLQRQRLECDCAPLSAAGLGMVAAAPLCGGLLGASDDQGVQPGRAPVPSAPGQAGIIDPQAAARRVYELARAAGESPAALAIAWCLRNRQISSVIVAVNHVNQLRENFGALTLLERHGGDAPLWIALEAALAG